MSISIGISLRIADIVRVATEIGEMGTSVRIGIDGPGVSGKSTLAAGLAEAMPPAVLVEGDDFYRPESDSSRSEIEIAGLFDLTRLASQVLIPHTENRGLHYQRYDWESEALGDWVIEPSGVPLIVEGVYSTHEALRDFYDLRIWVTARRAVRLSRGMARDGEEARGRWVDVWMPAEDRYVAEQAPPDHAHLVLDGSGAVTRQGDEVSYMVAGGLLSQAP